MSALILMLVGCSGAIASPALRLAVAVPSVRDAHRRASRDARQETPPKPRKSKPPEPTDEAQPPETEPPPGVGTADEVLKEILKQRPQKRLIPPTDGRKGTSGPTATWPEGWQLVSRAGRLVQDGKDWAFVFESDSPDHPEPRLKLLPNLKLETMVRETRAAGNAPVYIVSGEVTVYFGENYLLVRLALRRPDSGNLSK